MTETLIEKLEAAAEGSRVLDFAILDAIDWLQTPEAEAPRYTTSIDAALTLLPEGCAWKAQQNLDGACWAVIQKKTDIGWTIWEETPNVATIALALCIVALKARNAQCG